VDFLELACRAAVWAVFLAAVAGKARPRAYRGFVASLASVRRLPARLAGPAAAAVIAVECCAVLALSAPQTTVVGYGLAVAALAVFTVTAAEALRRGEQVQCRCFGADAGPIDRPQLARNGVLIAVALAGLAFRLAGTGGGWPDPAVTVTAVASGLGVAMTIVRWDDLAYLFGPSLYRRVS
jgi:hypothetical protein